MSVEAVNLDKVDADPGKMIAVRRLVKQFPEAIAYWHRSGATERHNGKHKHGVLAHQFSGGIFADEITAMLQEKGHLNESQRRETVLATLIHDADKPTDMAFIIMAMGGRDGQGEVSWAKVEEIVNRTDLTNKEIVIADLKVNYAKYFNKEVEVGERVHVARALVAGRVHKERLRAAGFSDRVIEIQGATEYTGCDEVDYLIDRFPKLTPGDKALVIQKMVINYIDNGMMESELVEPEVRTEAVFKKPINIALSKSYTAWNAKGETAQDKQIRVGNKVQDFLAGLVGVTPGDFLATLESRVQARLSSV